MATAKTTPPIIWADSALLAVLPLTKGFEPVRVWSAEERQYTAVQEQAEGIPVWEAQALWHIGYGRDLTPVKIRTTSPVLPAFRPEPLKLARLLGMSFEEDAQ